LLQERLKLLQISTGDMFRALAQTQSPLAEEVRVIQQAGRLIPDDLVIRVVEDRTSQPDCQSGYVLDGFPRTAAQAEMLEGLASRQGTALSAILIEIPFELLEKRMTGRRSCPVCGEIYNMYFRAPKNDSRCDLHPEAELIHRADDNEDKVRVRLDTFNSETAPVLEYYERSGRLHRVDGTQDPEDIYSAIERIVDGDQMFTAA
jgi:adenylate kinase